MKTSNPWRKSMLATLTAMTLLGLPRTAPAAPTDPWAAYGELVGEAEVAAEAGQARVAVERYTAAYDALPPDVRGGPFGRDVIDRVSSLTANATDPEVLRATLTLLDRHLVDAETTPEPADLSRYTQQRTEVARKLEAIEREAEEAPAQREVDQEERAPPLPPSAVRESPPTDAGGPRSNDRAVGIGLIATGGTVLAGSLAMFGVAGYHASLYSEADADEAECAADPACTTPPQEWENWREYNAARRNAVLVSGGVLAGVGAAVLIAGLVVFLRDRKKTAGVALLPRLDGGASAVVMGRF